MPEIIRVRRAIVEDIPAILGDLEEFSEFYGTKLKLYPGHDLARAKVAMLIKQQIFYVATKGSTVIGFVCGLLAPHFLNDDIITLTELLWWVNPEHRGSRAGAMLFNAFMGAGQRYAHWITMTLEVNSPVKPATLLKRGFRLQESYYIHEVQR